MAEQFKIGIDIDDTIAPYTEHFMRYLAREKNVPFESLEVPTTYDMHSFKGWDVNSFDEFIALHNKFVSEDFFSTCGIFPNVLETLDDLRSKGAYLVIITKRFCSDNLTDKYHVIGETMQYLRNNEVPLDEFMIANNKENILADLYIDDSPSNISKFVNAGRDVFVPHSTLHTPMTAKKFNAPLMDGKVIGGWDAGHSMILEKLDRFKVAQSPKVFA